MRGLVPRIHAFTREWSWMARMAVARIAGAGETPRMLPRRFSVRIPVLLVAALAMPGCAGFGDAAPEAVGLGAGAGAGILSANPLVGVAVAIGARFVTAEIVSYVRAEQRSRMQQAIAAAAGDAPDDTPVRWAIPPDAMFDTMFGSIAGDVQVVRDFGGRIHCREIVYTVDQPQGGVEGEVDTVESDVDDPGTPAAATPNDWTDTVTDPALVAIVCRGTGGWQWAVSDPLSHPSW